MIAQLTLRRHQFGGAPGTPRFVDAATAEAWFTELRTGVDWRAERRTMYDREVDVPRLMGHFRLDPPSDSTPDAILDASRRVTGGLEVTFNIDTGITASAR